MSGGQSAALPSASTARPWRVALSARLAHTFEVLPLVGYRGLAGGMPILIGLYIGHRWGLAALGAYTFASSFAAVGLVVTDWGCMRWLPRELALTALAGGDDTPTRTANLLRLVLAALYVALTAAMNAAGFISGDTARYCYELGALYFIAVVATNGISDLIVSRRTWRIAWAVGGGLAVFAGGAIAAERVTGSAHAIVAAYLAGKIAEAAVLIARRPRLLRFSVRHVTRTAMALAPFSAQAILAVLYSRLSIFVIGRLRPMSEVGLVGAAAALQGVVLLLPTSLALLYFPVMATAAMKGERTLLRRLVLRCVGGSAAGMIAGIVALALVRGRIADLLHVPAPYVAFLFAFLAVGFLTIGSTVSGASLQAVGAERLAAQLSVITLALSIAYQIGFIRAFGVWGVVYGTAAAELTSLLIFCTAAVRATRKRFAALPESED